MELVPVIAAFYRDRHKVDVVARLGRSAIDAAATAAATAHPDNQMQALTALKDRVRALLLEEKAAAAAAPMAPPPTTAPTTPAPALSSAAPAAEAPPPPPSEDEFQARLRALEIERERGLTSNPTQPPPVVAAPPSPLLPSSPQPQMAPATPPPPPQEWRAMLLASWEREWEYAPARSSLTWAGPVPSGASQARVSALIVPHALAAQTPVVKLSVRGPGGQHAEVLCVPPVATSAETNRGWTTLRGVGNAFRALATPWTLELRDAFGTPLDGAGGDGLMARVVRRGPGSADAALALPRARDVAAPGDRLLVRATGGGGGGVTWQGTAVAVSAEEISVSPHAAAMPGDWVDVVLANASRQWAALLEFR